VASVRGQAGGYTLSRPADRVSIAEVLGLLGGHFFGSQFCDRHAGLGRSCAHSGDCSLRLLWSTVQKTLDGILMKTTLKDLLRSETEMVDFLQHRMQVAAAEMAESAHAPVV
jgi:DNA-binding IscR family transcriptional regulator